MRKARYPGILRGRRDTQTVHILPCSCPTCSAEVTVPVLGKRKPPEVLHNIAKRRGWTVKKSTFTCPEHAQ